MKQRTVDFDEWVDGASEEEIKAMISTVRKRKFIFLGVWLIIAVILGAWFVLLKGNDPSGVIAAAIIFPGIPAGCACFCNNNLRTLKSRGRKVGGSTIGVWFYLIIGVLIMPIIVVQLASKSNRIARKILGFKG